MYVSFFGHTPELNPRKILAGTLGRYTPAVTTQAAPFDRLTALDRGFLDIEEHNLHMHVGSVAIFEMGDLGTTDGGVDIEKLRDYVESRLHRVPRYRQRIEYTPVGRNPIWVDDPHFNISYHVRHTALPRPGDDRQLKRLAGRLMSQQLDRGKPLWELWVVEGLLNRRLALVSKVHHCMIDGVSGAEILQQIFTPQPQGSFADPKPFEPRPLPPTRALVVNSAARRLNAPRGLVRAVTQAVSAPQDSLRRTIETVPAIGEVFDTWSQLASPTPINKPIGPHRRFDWLGMDIRRVRAVKTAMKGTVNDVVLTTVASGMSKFFERRGVSPAAQAQMRFRIYCPVSVRSEEEKGALGNRVIMAIVDLPLGEVEPQERLDRVQASFKKFRDTKQALGADVLTSMSEWVAPAITTQAFRLSYRRHTGNLIVTNVPGPQVDLFLLGARMLETYPLVPLYIDQTLGIALFSYAGGLYWGFNADWDTMPDLHDLVLDVDAAFSELERYAASKQN